MARLWAASASALSAFAAADSAWGNSVSATCHGESFKYRGANSAASSRAAVQGGLLLPRRSRPRNLARPHGDLAPGRPLTSPAEIGEGARAGPQQHVGELWPYLQSCNALRQDVPKRRREPRQPVEALEHGTEYKVLPGEASTLDGGPLFDAIEAVRAVAEYGPRGSRF